MIGKIAVLRRPLLAGLVLACVITLGLVPMAHAKKGGSGKGGSHGHGHGSGGSVGVPELDPGLTGGAAVLLIGGVLIVAERRRRKQP